MSGVLGFSCLRGSWGFELVESGVESDKALNGLFQRKLRLRERAFGHRTLHSEPFRYLNLLPEFV